MLECGKNFKGTMSETCKKCNVVDDEDHRLNHCLCYPDVNHCKNVLKVNFHDIYSKNPVVVRNIAHEIAKVWNLSNSHGVMNEN